MFGNLKSVYRQLCLITSPALFAWFSLLTACSPADDYQPQPLQGIIIIVGDGMGLSMISEASLEKGSPLYLETMPVVGLQKTSSATGSVTDSAAAITAMLSGHKTYNEWIGLDSRSNRVTTIFEIAKSRNWSTAIISTSSVTHATPAGAFVHIRNRHNDETIANQIAQNPPDILIGGGRDYFIPALAKLLPEEAFPAHLPKENLLSDTSDPASNEGVDSAMDSLRYHGLQLDYSNFMESKCSTLCINGEPTDQFLGLLARDHLPPVRVEHRIKYFKKSKTRDSAGPGSPAPDKTKANLDFSVIPEPEHRKDFLQLASLRSLRTLESRDRPFLMLIEGSQIDWGGHANASDYAISELMDLDETLGALLQETEGKNILIIVTADHETGGHAILEGSPGQKQKSDFLTHGHSAEMVPVYARGPGAETFTGTYENTEIFHKLLAVMEASPAISH